MLVLLVAGGLYGLVQHLNNVSIQTQRAQGTGQALQMAKSALIGYASSYRENHPVSGILVAGYGYLPCPDINGDGIEDTPCGTGTSMAIGLLPYKTLGLSALRDSENSCLWYAVAGSFKNSPSNAYLNWDTQGELTILDAAGTTTLWGPNNGTGGVAAIVIAAGAPLTGQNRTPNSLPCQTDATQIANFLEYSTTPFRQGPGKDSSEQLVLNDQLLPIGGKEIFTAIRKRSDFANYINTGVTNIATFLSSTLATNPPDNVNRLPVPAPSSLPPSDTNFYYQWYDQIRYQKCAVSGSYCYTVNGNTCDGILVWSGSGLTSGSSPPGDPRLASRRDEADYFENALALVTGGTTVPVSFAQGFSTTNPDTDIVLCLAPSSPINLTSLSAFNTQSNASNAVRVTTTTSASTLTLGSLTSAAAVYGCSWYPTPLALSGGIRIYFRFNIVERGQGFTIALADAGALTNPSPIMCGNSGSSLGYSGNSGVITPIKPPKLGLEFDTSSNASRNDSNNRHAAFVFWGGDSPNDDEDNVHGSCADPANTPCNPTTSPGRQTLSVLDSSNSGQGSPDGDVYVRIDVVPLSTGTVTDYQLYAYVTNDTYIKSTCELDGDASGTLISDVSDVATCMQAPTLSATLSTSMVKAYLGFTMGQTSGSGSRQSIVIDKFKARGRQ